MAPAVTRPAPADTVELLLRTIDAKLDRLLSNPAHVQVLPPSHLTREDRTRLARLLPAVGGVFGSELFATRELFASEAPAVQLVLDGLTPKQAGRLLRRGEGQAIDGYLVQREGIESGAALWRVVRVAGFPRLQNLSTPLDAPDGRG